MPQGKFTKPFDYRARKNAGPITSYLAKEYDDIPQAHFDAAVAAGAIDGAKAPVTKPEGTGDAKPPKPGA